MKIEMEWKPVEDASSNRQYFVCYKGSAYSFLAEMVYQKIDGTPSWVWRNDDGLIDTPDYFMDRPKTPFQISEEESKNENT